MEKIMKRHSQELSRARQFTLSLRNMHRARSRRELMQSRDKFTGRQSDVKLVCILIKAARSLAPRKF